MRLITACLLALILLSTGCGPETPEDEVRKTIAEMKVLIEQGKKQELITGYVYPDDRMKGSPERLVRDIPDEVWQNIHTLLTMTETLAGHPEKDNTEFVFEHESWPHELRFKKFDGRWWLGN